MLLFLRFKGSQKQKISTHMKLQENEINFSRNGILNYLKCIFWFMQTPFVKFVYNQVSWLMFLRRFLVKNIKWALFKFKISFFCFILLLSYVLLCDFYPVDYSGDFSFQINDGLFISIWEIILIVWVLNFALDEIIQV